MEKTFDRNDRPTIRDVAAEAGVSKSLVSLAFQDSSRVSSERLDRIRAAAESLGYRPNFLARTLATEGSPFVGILVVDLENPVLTEIAEAARVALHQHGQYGLVASATDVGAAYRGERYGEINEQVLDMFRDLRPRGLVIVGTSVEDARLPVGMPVVFASATAVRGSNHPSVRADDEAGIRLVMDHLVEQGHRVIGFVGGEGGGVSRGRHAAYLRFVRERGLPERAVKAAFSEEEGFEAATAMLTSGSRPTAIVAVSDLVALGVQSAADSMGLRVPEDLAIAGFDNTSIAAMSRISLTSVDPRNRDIGRLAADTIAESIVQPGRITEGVTLMPELVVRRSTTG
ncbi:MULTISPECIES: LacI family DNA-binding transcriptional regulator [Micrococcaceae]|uniref:LacI family DNA-binding transcriptional regulator n=1 Tax=unclassified Kocuria TaxID=2649579 RepID=UPI001010CB99|nr:MULTISPECIES: LacI family DNA-binding transcriptional regulator [unclassified Kocuria]